MKINKYKLYYFTQSKMFLLLMIFSIVALGLIISTITNSTKKDTLETKSTIHNLLTLSQNDIKRDSYNTELSNTLTNSKLDLEEFVNFIEGISTLGIPSITNATIQMLENAIKINGSFQTFSLYLKVNTNISPISDLIEFATANPDLYYTNRLLSYFYWSKKDLANALEYLEKEPTLKTSETCKERLVFFLIQLKKMDQLDKLLRDSNYKNQHKNINKFLISQKKDLPFIFKEIVKSQIHIDINGIFYVALLTGIIWFSIWFHALRPEKPISALLLSICAFFLGVFSVTLTLFCIYIQEHIYQFNMGDSIIQGLLYFILGVGLREEFFKALVFLILVPILIKRKNPIEWLIIPGMVGLGFAAEENLNYFLSNIEAVGGRFLTANFLHVGLTALVGESICYYFYNRSKGPEHLISTFSMAVILHGAYDAFIVVNGLNQVPFVTMLVLIFIAFQFFGRLKLLRNNQIELVSLSTHFIFGLTVLFMAAFIYISYQVGHFEAFRTLSESILGLAIIVYMFLYVMPNSIIKV